MKAMYVVEKTKFAWRCSLAFQFDNGLTVDVPAPRAFRTEQEAHSWGQWQIDIRGRRHGTV